MNARMPPEVLGQARPLPLRMREGFGEFLHTEVAGAVALLVATVVALALANSPLYPLYDAFWHTQAGVTVGSWGFSESLVHWVNDLLMAFFFLVVGLVVGKPIGITLMSFLAVKLRVADLPQGVGWTQVVGAGMLGGIGFTMSLFVASLAFRGTAEIAEAKMAILLASAAAGVAGFLMLRFARPSTARQEQT